MKAKHIIPLAILIIILIAVVLVLSPILAVLAIFYLIFAYPAEQKYKYLTEVAKLNAGNVSSNQKRSNTKGRMGVFKKFDLGSISKAFVQVSDDKGGQR